MNDVVLTYQQQLNQEQSLLLEHISSALLQAEKLGASSAQVAASKTKGLEVNVRLGEVDTVEFTQDNSIDITVYFGQRCGVASTTEFGKASIMETVEMACEIAKSTAEDPCAGLADRHLMAYDHPNLNLYFPWQIDTIDAIARARECEAAGRDSDSRIVNSDGASISTHCGVYAYGNSHGFIGAYPWSRHSQSCVLVAKDQDDKMQRDSEYTISRNPNLLLSHKELGKLAADRTVKRLGARSIKTCQVPVIFSAEIASGLFSPFISAISGNQLYRRNSFLVDSIQQMIFPSSLTVTEDPLIPSGLGSSPFDAEGVITKKRNIVEAGQLQAYVLSSYSARKLGLQTTGNAGGVHNLIFSHSDKSFADLLKEMGTGLVVNDVMGNGIRLTTGDYSQGASGFWVENGEIQYPVEGITIAGNLRDMFKNIRVIGNDVDQRHKLLTGSVLIDGMTIAGY